MKQLKGSKTPSLMYEMKLVLANLILRCQMARVDNRPIRPIRSNITLAPAGGIKMIMKRRRVPQ